MANVITELTARIEEYLADNKNPCKNYATEATAEKAAQKMAKAAGEYFTMKGETVKPARYVVFKVEAWGRWVACFDMTELMQRSTSTGGYIGFCTGFFCF